MKTIFASLPALTGLFLLASCSSTVNDRVHEHRDVFNTLSMEDRAYIVRGQVNTGMSPEAAKIAWGEPDTVSKGMLGKKAAERWIYDNKENTGFILNMGAGTKRSNNANGYGLGAGAEIPINFIPADVSYILFKDGKVVSWRGNGNK